jgi:hypothetical protein
MEYGKKNWVFCDGDLPPAGNNADFAGHEALMITNITDEDAVIKITVLFEDKEPVKGIKVELKAERTMCIRLDKPFGEQRYKIPFGQYALHLKSSVPVCACFGRLDVRQANMAYYSLGGYAF